MVNGVSDDANLSVLKVCVARITVRMNEFPQLAMDLVPRPPDGARRDHRARRVFTLAHHCVPLHALAILNDGLGDVINRAAFACVA